MSLQKKFFKPSTNEKFGKTGVSSGFKKSSQEFFPKKELSDFEKRKIAEQRATKRLKGEPTNLGWLSNIFIGGEDYHKNHHEKPGNLVYGKYDWTGKFIVPLLLK